MRPNPSPRKNVTPVLRIHNYALEIPWVQGEGHHHGTPQDAASTALGVPALLFFSFRTLISGNPVRQHDCRTHDAATKEAESYVTPRNSQVDYDNE